MNELSSRRACSAVMLTVCLLLTPTVMGTAWAQTDTRVFSLVILEDQYQDPAYVALPSFSEADAYAGLLRERSGIIRQRSYTNLTKEQIRNTLATISTDTLLLLFRGHVTRSEATNRVSLLPVDSVSGDVSSFISIAELNQWMQGIPQQILLLDTYTAGTDLMGYYANREVAGTSALISIQQDTALSTLADAFVQLVREADTADTDADRQLTLREVYQDVQERMESAGILAPTGRMDAVLMRLPSRLFVETVPAEAQVWVNDDAVGVSPYTQEGIYPGEYRIRVELPGFYRPPEELRSIESTRGEGANVRLELKRIQIRGKVHDEQGRGVVPSIVQIQGTNYAVKTDETGEFAFSEVELEADTTYVLAATAGDGIFVGTQSFLYGGYEDIFQNVLMHQRPWLEVAQERFAAGNLQDAADKFRLAVQERYELPALPPDFAEMALAYSDEWIQQSPDHVAAVLAAAQLAEQLGRRGEAKRHWALAKRRADANSAEYQFAAARLKALTPWKSYILIGGLVVLLLTALSAGLLIYRAQRSRLSDSDQAKPI